MSFYIDLAAISIDQYKKKLENADLVPSRQLLKQNTDVVFQKLKACGLKTTEDLFNALKTKTKVQHFSQKSNIDENYLTILIRELKGYRQPPVKICDFPKLGKEVVIALEKIGIKNTLQLFEHIKTHNDRHQLALRTGLDSNTILTLAKLTDLSRVRWVNHTFAYAMLNSEVECVEQLANISIELLHQKINETNTRLNLYKGKIGIHDMKLTIDSAKEMSIDVDFNDT